MKTQLSVLVKKESLYSRMVGKWQLGPFSFFGARPVEIILDGEVHSVKPSASPYVFDLTPGTHTVRFHDPKQENKRAFSRFNAAFQGTVWGFAIGGATGGSASLGALLGGNVGKSMQGTIHEDGTLEVTVGDGDLLKLQCKNTRKGVVKVSAQR